MPRKVFTAGEVLAAADVNTFLMNQAVMTFAGSAARSSAISTATASEGMVTYLADTDTFQFWNGSAFVPLTTSAPTLEYLVIGGGGGGGRIGGSEPGGGGGAGGYRSNVVGQLTGGSATAEPAEPYIINTAYRITVGAGGASVAADYSPGLIGNRSVLGSITSQGGGGGRTRFTGDNATGGSGGGGNHHHTTRGWGIVGEGFNGGTGPGANNIWGSAGGGGAGALGVSTTTTTGGAGGAGLSSNITGFATTRAGGGGGGGQVGAGAGGAGGGGAGATPNNNATAGTVNTGGGGGGVCNATSGAGGSGIVVFSVPTTATVTFSAGVTQTNSVVNSRRVYVVTATSTTSETVTFS